MENTAVIPKSEEDLLTELALLKAENLALTERCGCKKSDVFIARYLEPILDRRATFPARFFGALSAEYSNLGGQSREIIEIRARSLDYEKFLQTAYWRIIANYVRQQKGYACTVCPSVVDIQVHHRTYEHHGREIEFWDKDLIPLCGACHDKLSPKAAFGNRRMRRDRGPVRELTEEGL